MTPAQALAFVEGHGVVLQAARGPVPSFAEHVAGAPIKGSWWAHAKAHEIFELASIVSGHRDVLVCKLVQGKVTYVHRRIWPALIKLAARFDPGQLARVENGHTQSGLHRSCSTPFPNWVPDDAARAAKAMSAAVAERTLALALAPEKRPAARKP